MPAPPPSPYQHEECYVTAGWNVVDTVCMVFFVIEVWLKALARGFIRGTNPLAKSSWQILEVSEALTTATATANATANAVPLVVT